MTNDIYNKFIELTNEYNDLCFKIKQGNFFIIGIQTNEGVLCYTFDISLYDLFCRLNTLHRSFIKEYEAIGRLDLAEKVYLFFFMWISK